MSKADEAKKTITIENVVASTAIGQEIDLKSVTLALDGADYDPEQFPGLVYRTKEPKTAALIFRSGKIVCTGAKSIEDVDRGLKKVFGKMNSVGIKVVGTPDITVQNIVASADLGSVLNLNAIAIGLGPGEHRVRARAVPRPGLQDRQAEGRRAVVRQRQAGRHRRQEAERRGGSRRADRPRAGRPGLNLGPASTGLLIFY